MRGRGGSNYISHTLCMRFYNGGDFIVALCKLNTKDRLLSLYTDTCLLSRLCSLKKSQTVFMRVLAEMVILTILCISDRLSAIISEKALLFERLLYLCALFCLQCSTLQYRTQILAISIVRSYEWQPNSEPYRTTFLGPFGWGSTLARY